MAMKLDLVREPAGGSLHSSLTFLSLSAVYDCGISWSYSLTIFYQVVAAKRFEGVLLCKKVCFIPKSNS